MTDVLQSEVLVLNKNWQPLEEKNARRAFEDVNSGSYTVDEEGHEIWTPPFLCMDIELTEDGELVYANPVEWDEWVKLPVRPGDGFVHTGRHTIRVPEVIISTQFSRIHVRPVKLSNSAIHRRDKHQCQYCHQFFPLEELNVDHVIPQHHGGEDAWDNLVCSCRKCNTRKGHKFNQEIGYKLLKQPREPLALPSTFITVARKKSWIPFLPSLKN